MTKGNMTFAVKLKTLVGRRIRYGNGPEQGETVLKQVGEDYITLEADGGDVIVPLHSLLWIKTMEE